MNTARHRTWLNIVGNLPLRGAGPDSYFEELSSVSIDDTCDRESLLYYEYLRYRAWHGQEQSITGPSDPRVTAARRWTNLLVASAQTPAAVQQIVLLDERFYVRESNRILPKTKWNATKRSRMAGETPYQSTNQQLDDKWKNVLLFLDKVLPSEQDHQQGRLTPAELELALVVFDWSHPTPRFAKWLYYSPTTLRDVHGYLLRRYSWELLEGLEAARSPILYPRDDAPDFKSKAFHADTGARWRFRLWGIIVVGFISAFAIDSLQHLVWFGPWLVSLILSASAASLTYLLALVDVNKQHGGEIDRQIARGRAKRLSCALLGRSVPFALFATLVMFTSVYGELSTGWFLVSDGSTYLTEHPLQTFAGKPVCGEVFIAREQPCMIMHWIVVSLTLGSLSALLGITVQWLWEDKSAIEPI